MDETCTHLRGTFDAVADHYDTARPSYPDALFDDLVALARLEEGSRLLEIGCGTGKATRPLLARGFSVTCVEIGARLAARAREELAGLPVDIHVEPFETWGDGDAEFDLVYAATAWHWIDKAVRYRKAQQVLRPGGHLAFWSAEHAFPADVDPFFTEIQSVYDDIGESHPGEWPPPLPEQVADQDAEIRKSGCFDDVAVRRYVWATRYTAAEYIALLDTFSGHIAMDEDKREYLYREIKRQLDARESRSVMRHWLAVLHVSRRIDNLT